MQRLAVAIAAALVVISALALTHPLYSGTPAPPQKQSALPTAGMEVATFAGGCFWSMEYAFDKAPGVKETVSGFMGGKTPNPTYAQVSRGNTGHAESVQVTYRSATAHRRRRQAPPPWRTTARGGRAPTDRARARPA